MVSSPKIRVALALVATLGMIPGCSRDEHATTSPGTKDDGTQTLAAALAGSDEFGSLRKAIEHSELMTVFDGPASYTLLAPTDEAFTGLGEQSTALMSDGRRPVLVAILRNHLLPGHLTPESIAEAIARRGGPVSMTTLGQGKVTFARTKDAITVTLDDGSPARLVGTAVAANNGVLLPVDRLLLPPRRPTRPNSPG